MLYGVVEFQDAGSDLVAELTDGAGRAGGPPRLDSDARQAPLRGMM